MRVSPVGWAFDKEEDVLKAAKESAECTHNHVEGVKGAEATAWCIWAARKGLGKEAIRKAVTERWGYNLARKLDDIRPTYGFNETCQGSVPESILCFLESGDYEDTIRLAVSLGGDCDTMACIAGGMAEAHYGRIPETMAREGFRRLDNNLRTVTSTFVRKYIDPKFELDVPKADTKEDLVSLMGTLFS